MDLLQELRRLIPDERRVTVNETILEQHSRDLTYHKPHKPDVVVFPKDKREVQKVLQFANKHRIPVVPYGVGSSLEGHTIPTYGGISLDMTMMNRVLEIRPQDFLVRVEAGVTRNQLNQQLKPHGLFFPIDPGADATLGGMAATNASGTNAVRYGVMRQQVLGLEVVLADGTIITTGGMAVKSSAGYHLTGLFVGSEGTLGVITELTLRLYGIPEAVVAARAVFPDVESAGEAAVGMIASGIAIGKVELVDARTVAAVNAYKGTAYAEAPTLFLEFSGHSQTVRHEVEVAREIAMEHGCRSFEQETDPKARALLWEARHQAGLAIAASAPGKKLMATDVCVPISFLPEAIRHTRQLIDSYGMEAAIFGHVGDGNYHAAFIMDPNHPDDVKRAEEVNEQVVRFALEKGGTCTGEHGIGLGKIKYLKAEHGDSLAVMKAIKQVLDPGQILNPGKVLPE
ncbi:MAG: 2-hydroxy-acid oxidase [Bacillus thermozeamaize]|jgi:D-lactate dehydrogenase (cytochrome)|uniref:D-lactate dehydrogenase (cytochrome) n=1 Tax=Bacillus thermozeamaize TaxID=230954 RepID=A0A1Y3PK25_9BACI|nr:MAG: 2-hydroxy-acid oxidase [Bacillus thermozeamaize]